MSTPPVVLPGRSSTEERVQATEPALLNQIWEPRGYTPYTTNPEDDPDYQAPPTSPEPVVHPPAEVVEPPLPPGTHPPTEVIEPPERPPSPDPVVHPPTEIIEPPPFPMEEPGGPAPGDETPAPPDLTETEFGPPSLAELNGEWDPGEGQGWWRAATDPEGSWRYFGPGEVPGEAAPVPGQDPNAPQGPADGQEDPYIDPDPVDVPDPSQIDPNLPVPEVPPTEGEPPVIETSPVDPMAIGANDPWFSSYGLDDTSPEALAVARQRQNLTSQFLLQNWGSNPGAWNVDVHDGGSPADLAQWRQDALVGNITRLSIPGASQWFSAEPTRAFIEEMAQGYSNGLHAVDPGVMERIRLGPSREVELEFGMRYQDNWDVRSMLESFSSPPIFWGDRKGFDSGEWATHLLPDDLRQELESIHEQGFTPFSRLRLTAAMVGARQRQQGEFQALRDEWYELVAPYGAQSGGGDADSYGGRVGAWSPVYLPAGISIYANSGTSAVVEGGAFNQAAWSTHVTELADGTRASDEVIALRLMSGFYDPVTGNPIIDSGSGMPVGFALAEQLAWQEDGSHNFHGTSGEYDAYDEAGNWLGRTPDGATGEGNHQWFDPFFGLVTPSEYAAGQGSMDLEAYLQQGGGGVKRVRAADTIERWAPTALAIGSMFAIGPLAAAWAPALGGGAIGAISANVLAGLALQGGSQLLTGNLDPGSLLVGAAGSFVGGLGRANIIPGWAGAAGSTILRGLKDGELTIDEVVFGAVSYGLGNIVPEMNNWQRMLTDMGVSALAGQDVEEAIIRGLINTALQSAQGETEEP